METTHQSRFTAGRHRGPHPGIIAVVYTCLFIASILVYFVLARGNAFPRPYAPAAELQHLYLEFAAAVRANALLQFGAAIPLGIFTAAVTSRLHFLGLRVTGVHIALFGGIAASLLVTLSALCNWVLSQPGIVEDLPLMQALRLLSFVTGGVGHTVALGLLMAGISVPCLLGGFAPRWIAWLGLVLAALAVLSTLSLVLPLLNVLLPVVRFGSYVWMIGTGFTLSKGLAAERS
ncbi:hypothetical protein [Taibaiella helva]|uniref:hypothetical protein n=1 Tax=Taibaiella helva TaxID=2301235 RepID=UPI001300755A|nr:hypothetical protein [Taibaiella helva]